MAPIVDRLHRIDERGERQAVFAHPISGPLTPHQAILMLDVHLRRHARQVRRLIASLSHLEFIDGNSDLEGSS